MTDLTIYEPELAPITISDHGVLDYEAQGPTLQTFHESDSPVRCLIGPLGSSKTHACIVELIDHMFNQATDVNGVRWTRIICVRNTLPDLWTTTITDVKQVLGPLLAYGIFTSGTPPTWKARFQRQDDMTTVDTEWIFLAFDHVEDAKKARGLQVSAVWGNEASELAQINLSMLQGRIGRFPNRAMVPDGQHFMILDTNMPDRDHWLVKMAYETKPKNWWFGIQPPAVLRDGGDWRVNHNAENLHNLPVNYYENLVQGKPEQWIQRYLENKPVFLADGRPVHPKFDENIHVRTIKPTPMVPLIVGIDFGRTPAACICQQQLNDTWYVLDEFCTDNMGALEFGRQLTRYLSKHYPDFQIGFFGDPAGNHKAQTDDYTPFMMLEKNGIFARPTDTNDYEKRTTVLDNQLSRVNMFFIDVDCTTTIKGLAGAYMFKRVRISGEERYHDEPVKDATSHVCEALHYAMLGAGLGDATWMPDDWLEEYEEVEHWHPAKAQFS